jgi:FkbM family methyltransferase
MPRRASAHLRLVSDAHVRRHFDHIPGEDSARDLLARVNARAPAGAPVRPGARPLWIYGASALGRRGHAYFRAVGQAVSGVIDAEASAYVNDPAWAGICVLAPDVVPAGVRAGALVAIADAGRPFTQTEEMLNDLGWRHCVPLHDVTEAFVDQQPLASGWFAPRLGADELEAAGRVLGGFSDAESRAHYLRVAAWRFARQEWDFAGAPVEPATCFFIPDVTRALRPGERVLDGGAHHGAVIARLLEQAPGSISAIWAVEPDPDNRAALQAWVAQLDLDLRARVLILDAVLGDRAAAVRFHRGLGPCSRIAASGQTLRAAVPLDALALDPSFVKLHLEGGELKALVGARQTLLRHRPIIAATVHHDAAGLIDTPAWLMRELPDYAVLMRTHGWCGSGAVLYAIPKERTLP